MPPVFTDQHEAVRYQSPRSALYPQEYLFRAQVFQSLEKLGIRVQVERGMHFGDMSLRWDIGLKVGASPFRAEDVIIECKTVGGLPNLERSLGQALLYRECRCARVVLLCFPSDLELPLLFVRTCESLGIPVANELNVLQIVAMILQSVIMNIKRLGGRSAGSLSPL
jgi:hypothetical protein